MAAIGLCWDIKYCTLFVGNFVPFHSDIGTFLDGDLLSIEGSKLLFNQPDCHK